jgi:hypothetical protein
MHALLTHHHALPSLVPATLLTDPLTQTLNKILNLAAEFMGEEASDVGFLGYTLDMHLTSLTRLQNALPASKASLMFDMGYFYE